MFLFFFSYYIVSDLTIPHNVFVAAVSVSVHVCVLIHTTCKWLVSQSGSEIEQSIIVRRNGA